MKKLVIIGSIVAIAILIIALLFRGSHFSSQAEIRTMTVAQIHQLLSGDWVQEDSLGSLVLRPKGEYHWTMYSQRIQHDAIPKDASQWLYEGTWEVKDGVLVLSISFANSRNTTNVEAVGTVDNYRVVKVDASKLALEKDGVTTDFHR